MKTKLAEIPAVAIVRRSRHKSKDPTKQDQKDSHERQWANVERLTPHNPNEKYIIARTFKESGSGWKPCRPEFDRLLAFCQARHAEGNPIRVILCDEFSRFSRRKIDEVQRDVSAFKAAGVQVIHVADGNHVYRIADMNDELGDYIQFVCKAFDAHDESKKISRRVSGQQIMLAKAGKGCGGRRKYGYTQVKAEGGGTRHGKIVKAEAKVIRWLFDQFANHQKSYRAIAIALNDRGIPSSIGNTGTWSGTQIRRMLEDKTYIGHFAFGRTAVGAFNRVTKLTNGDVVSEKVTDDLPIVFHKQPLIERENTHDAIVGEKLFAKASRRIKRLDARYKKNNSRNTSKHILSGLTSCGCCGSGLASASRPGKALRYVCLKQHNDKGVHAWFSVTEAEVLGPVVMAIRDGVDDLHAKLLERKESAPLESSAVQSLTARLGELEVELATVKAALVKATRRGQTAVADALAEDMESLASEITEARDRLAAATLEADSGSDDWIDQLEAARNYLATGILDETAKYFGEKYGSEMYGNELSRLAGRDPKFRNRLREMLENLGCEITVDYDFDAKCLTSISYRLGQQSHILTRLPAQTSSAGCTGTSGGGVWIDWWSLQLCYGRECKRNKLGIKYTDQDTKSSSSVGVGGVDGRYSGCGFSAAAGCDDVGVDGVRSLAGCLGRVVGGGVVGRSLVAGGDCWRG